MIEGAHGVEPAACYINIRFSVTDERPTSSYGAVKILICTSVYLKHQDFYTGFKHLCVSICSNLTVTFGATHSRIENTVLH